MRRLLLIPLLLWSSLALAEEAMPRATSTATSWRERFDLGYSAWFRGSTLAHPDGNTDGRGSSLSLRQYLTGSFFFAPTWKVEGGWEARRYWRPIEPKKKSRPDWEPRDPYAELTGKDLLQAPGFTLGAKVRFTFPASDYTRSRWGKIDDEGRGQIRAGLRPEASFAQGDLLVLCPLDFYWAFAEMPQKIHYTHGFRARPQLRLRLARDWQARVEYSTGYFRQRSNGSWTTWREKDDGQELIVGPWWAPVSGLYLAPMVHWGEGPLELRDTKFSLFASYAFL